METMKIFFNGTTDADFKSSYKQSVNWDALIPAISEFVKLRKEWEVINGLIITDTDIQVSIGRKRGRKTNVNGK